MLCLCVFCFIKLFAINAYIFATQSLCVVLETAMEGELQIQVCLMRAAMPQTASGKNQNLHADEVAGTASVHIKRRSAVDLAYVVHGKKTTKEPIIVLHGLLGSKQNWAGLSKKFAEAMATAVYAVDARNHGQSPHASSHTYFDLASDVSQFIGKWSLTDPTVIGHSMGGRTAMVLALTEPSKVKRLVVADVSPVTFAGSFNDFFPKLIDAMKTVKFEPGANAANAKVAAKKALAKTNIVDDVEGLNFILMNIDERPDRSIGWVYNLEVLKSHIRNIATFPSELAGKQFKGPTLFVAGGLSDYLPPSDLTAIRKFFPKATLEVLPNSGHNVHAEDPAGFFNIVMKFLTTT